MKVFDRIQLKSPKRSAFNLSHGRKFSMNMGDLVPVLCTEVIPNDKIRLNMEHLVRLQPLLAPMMHHVNVTTHFFFVPNRLVWNDWENFITGGEKGNSNPVFPTLSKSTSAPYNLIGLGIGTLADYLGVPVKQFAGKSGTLEENQISALPFRAYQLIYNEYYRDQNLEDPINFGKSSGSTQLENITIAQNIPGTQLLKLRKRAWEKDYFTSALPFAQKGEQMSIPLVGQANVKLHSSSGSDLISGNSNTQGQISLTTDPNTSGVLRADLTGSSGTTINELRAASRIQRWAEKNARGGSRYVETILSHFGIKSSDARLQRPEYLGGGKTPITISEVLQNSASEEDSPQGTMAGHGVSPGSTNQFSRRFEEHGYIIGIMSIMPRTGYFQGLPRHFMKTDKFEFAWPDLAHMGEQQVHSGELFFNPTDPSNKNSFGYQPRYSEYRFINDTVHGDFVDTLKYWHMAREFEERPYLNESFIKANPTNRVFAVEDPTYPKLLVQTYSKMQAIRSLPKYGNPGML